MSVNVTMPDGSVQRFPSRKRLVENPEDVGSPPLAIEEPEASLTWKFWFSNDTWRAVRR
jgi:hypothetical protein